MDEDKGRAVSVRHTELGSAAEIAARLQFLFVVIGGPLGLIAAVVGARGANWGLLIVGVAVAVSALALWIRRRARLAAIARAIEKNPFKPERAPRK